MTTFILLASALLPAIVLLFYILRRDPQPEPRAWLAKAIGYGVLICVPISFVEYAISALLFGAEGEPATLVGTTLQSFLVAALPEEGFKLWALWRVLRKNPYYDEHFDGIVYAVCVSLGFAAIENITYIFSYSDQWAQVAVSRALLAVPGHYAFAVLMGYYYSVYHFIAPTMRNKVLILLAPVVAHGIYDAIAMGSDVSPLLGSVGTFVLLWFCYRMHKFSQQKIVAHLKRDWEQPPVA
mgnify:CR=1 FL=1